MPSHVEYTTALAETPCRQCGTLAPHRIESGSWGPHRRRLVCEACGAFMHWLPVRSPEQRRQHREVALAQWMAQQPPTAKQLTFLQELGHSGQAANRLEASDIIDRLLQQRGVRRVRS